jgi:hypothetical protein
MSHDASQPSPRATERKRSVDNRRHDRQSCAVRECAGRGCGVGPRAGGLRSTVGLGAAPLTGLSVCRTVVVVRSKSTEVCHVRTATPMGTANVPRQDVAVDGRGDRGRRVRRDRSGGSRHGESRPRRRRPRPGPYRRRCRSWHRHQRPPGVRRHPVRRAPVGDLRWAEPRPAKPWAGTRDATKPGNSCPQTEGFLGDAASDTEDCLYLNVTTPRNSGGTKLPVMFWVHGGGFYSGSGSLYGAQRLAEQGKVIVVTLNYRLGVFGFLAHPALGHTTSGDYGLEDQQAALRWVRDNAAAFGGDSGNVTLFGESAGGVSTCSHLVAPASAGLFRRAIIQSGPCGDLARTWPYTEGNWGVRPRAVAERQGASLAAAVGCGDVKDAAACLRGKLVSALLEASQGGQGFGPAAGGKVLPAIPATAIASGRFNRVPVINGTTATSTVRSSPPSRASPGTRSPRPTTARTSRTSTARTRPPGSGSSTRSARTTPPARHSPRSGPTPPGRARRSTPTGC